MGEKLEGGRTTGFGELDFGQHQMRRKGTVASAKHGGKNISAVNVTVLQSTSTNSYCKVLG